MRGSMSRNVSWCTDDLINLMERLLEMDPTKRITAGDAFVHDFFVNHPRWVPAEELDMNFKVKSMHEYQSRNRKKA